LQIPLKESVEELFGDLLVVAHLFVEFEVVVDEVLECIFRDLAEPSGR
jgi:hypothetical protein